MESISLAVAAVLGAVIVALLVILIKRQPAQAPDSDAAALRSEIGELQRRLAVEEHKSLRAAELEKTLAERDRAIDALREARHHAEQDAARISATLAGRTDEFARLGERLAEESKARAAAEAEVGRLQSRVAALEEKLEQEGKQSGEKLRLLEQARERMTQEFKVLAAEVMKSHGETFSKQNHDQLNVILTPLREKLTEFQTGLAAAHTESAKERAVLAEQIGKLSEQSARMTSETTNLTRALKGETKTQGAWGEMILNTILERSALREGVEYEVQQSHTTEDGKSVITDVIVNLPGNDNFISDKFIIDAKVSLVAFNDYVNATDEIERATHLKSHLDSVRRHIKTLSGKEYHSAAGSKLDYVVMFIPIEGALAAVLQADPNLTSDAVRANVAIATPTTLMIALRTVANIWKLERRNKSAEEIAERAGKIYDKFVNFAGDMTDLGGRLNQARLAYEGAMGKLSTGPGNLVRQVEMLKELGAKTAKSLPPKLLEQDDADPVQVQKAAGA